jgi:mRNA-degrading endonuclease RelE of RelBE toxin-antitoxin system
MWAIRFARDVEKDLRKIPAHQRRAMLDAIELKLSHEPAVVTRNRKLLMNLIPPWEAEPPVWELRVGRYRVFYDVSEEDQTVYVRAIREKPPVETTEEVL